MGFNGGFLQVNKILNIQYDHYIEGKCDCHTIYGFCTRTKEFVSQLSYGPGTK